MVMYFADTFVFNHTEWAVSTCGCWIKMIRANLFPTTPNVEIPWKLDTMNAALRAAAEQHRIKCSTI